MVNRTYWDSFDCEQQCEEYFDESLEEIIRITKEEEAQTADYFTVQTTLQLEALASYKGEQG